MLSAEAYSAELRTQSSKLSTHNSLWQVAMRLLIVLLVIACALAIALLPLTSAAVLVAGCAVVVATLIRPAVSLCLLAFAVPFGSVRSLAVGGMSITATEALVALLAAAWLARGVYLRSVRLVHAPLIIPLAFILLAQLLSLFDALSLSLALKEIIKWAEILAVYIIAASILSEPDQAESPSPALLALLLALLAAAAVEALLGAYQFVRRAGPEWFYIGRFMRAYGTFAQPNPFAGYLNLTLPLGYALLLWSLHGNPARALALRLGGQRLARWLPLLAAGWLALVGGALLMSMSRGAWLGCAVAVAAVSMLYSRRTAAYTSLGGILLAALLILGSADLLPTAITDRLAGLADYVRIFDVRHVEVTDANFAVVERMAHWQAAWSMINARPWLGFGAGNYPAAYATYALAGWKEPLGHAHNVLLNVWAETGIIGLAFYVFFLAAALWLCWRTAARQRQTPGPPGAAGLPWFARAVALGVLGVLLAKITHEMLDNLWVHSMGVHVALLLAMVSALDAPPRLR